MSSDALKWLHHLRKGLTAREYRVLEALCWFHTDDRGCFPSQGRLAHECEMPASTLNVQLRQLERKGLIRRERRKDPVTHIQRTTYYWLAFGESFNEVVQGGKQAQHLAHLGGMRAPGSGVGKADSRNRQKPTPETSKSRLQKLETNQTKEKEKQFARVSRPDASGRPQTSCGARQQGLSNSGRQLLRDSAHAQPRPEPYSGAWCAKLYGVLFDGVEKEVTRPPTALQQMQLAEGGQLAQRVLLNRQALYGFPTLSRMLEDAVDDRSTAVESWAFACGDLFERVHVGSARYREWEYEHGRRGWPWFPEKPRSHVWLPRGGPSGLEVFREEFCQRRELHLRSADQAVRKNVSIETSPASAEEPGSSGAAVLNVSGLRGVALQKAANCSSKADAAILEPPPAVSSLAGSHDVLDAISERAAS